MDRLIAASVMTVLLGSATAHAGGTVDFSAWDKQAGALLAQMTLDEKIGQMTQPDQEFLKDEADIEKYGFGSIQSGGGSDPRTNSVLDWTAMYERYQARMGKTRLKIPLLYGVDAVHGHSNVLGAVVFPHNIGLGAARDAALVEEIARITAEEVRATGINWSFAPCIAVPRDERWGRTYEGFSEDPKLVGELGAAAVRGLQGASLDDPLRVLACAKHFAGDGGTTWGTGMKDWRSPGVVFPLDRGDTRGDEATLRSLHIAHYAGAIAAGVGSIMPSFNSWNGERASGSKRLLTDILKGELGFGGFLISDYNAVDDLPGDYAAQVKQSVNAGMDMVMAPSRYREFFTTLKGLVKKGEVPMSRIDDAVRRILRVKIAMGLLEPGRVLTADRRLQQAFGGAAHREVARRAVRQSLVLLKNENGTLPLEKDVKRVHVAGASADDLGNQCGGWTIDWQGKSGPSTHGTTILGGVLQALGAQTKVTFSKDGSGAAGADAAVVVIGETPYTEFFGDRVDLGLSAEDVAIVSAVKRTGVPTVVVLLSGRPLILGDVLTQADALVAAWLPGSEGGGIADVLFGDHGPSGKLSFTWPRSMDQVPINVGDAKYDPLFPFGFGLTYDEAPGASFAGDYKILARDSGKAVAIAGASKDDGAGVVLAGFTSRKPFNDEWRIASAGGGFYRIVSRESGQPLVAASAANGGEVRQRAEPAPHSDEWRLSAVGGGFYKIVNRRSGRALSVANFGKTEGTPVIQWTYDSGFTNSQFQIVKLR